MADYRMAAGVPASTYIPTPILLLQKRLFNRQPNMMPLGIGIATVGVATLATPTLSNTVVLPRVSNITHLATLLIIINIVINLLIIN